MLAERDSIEIAPFVQSWNPGLDALASRRLPAFFAREFKEALTSRFDSKLERAFKAGVESVTRSGSTGTVFTALEEAMISTLRTCLKVEPGASDYLQPIVGIDGGPVRVATLNYDHSVELAAHRSGKSVATGITLWDGGLEWDFEAGADVNLLKLHGSLDWYYSKTHRGWGTLEERSIVPFHVFTDDGPTYFDEPAVVFGQRGKLRSDGPFLGMLTGFDHWLKQTQNLVIVGYSFRDDHINEVIRRWVNRAYKPRMIIVDPAMTDEVMSTWRHDGFLGELVRALSYIDEGGKFARLPQHDVHALPASQGLALL